MLQNTLKSVGLTTDYDIPAGEIFSNNLNAEKYGLCPQQMEIIHCLRDFVMEYNRELPIDLSTPVRSSEDAAAIAYPSMRGLASEEAKCLFLNTMNVPLALETISFGGLSSTIIDARAVVKKALDCNAAGVILFHNHPSGNPTPSTSDLKQTDGVRKCLSVFEIKLLDHIIISDSCFFSFADEAISRYNL